MKKRGIETIVTILSIFIVAAVVMSGYLVYQSLSQIVSSIHKEARPDYKIIVIKDIALDLSEIENNIQLYTLTKNKANLKDYEKVNKRLESRIALLAGLSTEENEVSHLIDSVKYMVEMKLGIWKEIKRINSIQYNPEEQFEELYSMLEKKEIDTIKVEVEVEPPREKRFFKRIFGKKDTVTTRVDTTFVEKTVENEEIKEEIQQLQTDMIEREQNKNKLELQLIEQNIQVTGKLNNLIARIEKSETDGLMEKTGEADRLATLTYNRLSAFAILAVVLLCVVLFLFFRYLQKARTYQRVLTKAKHDAERLSKAKEIFIANVSHEMRTPVNAIYGLTEQLLQQQKGKRAQEQLAIVLKSAEHLKNVVNDTLDFSKIQANKLSLEKVDFSPEEVIREIFDLHKPEAIKKNIDLFYNVKNKLPLALLGDPFRLKQILINIVGNSIKFTEKGSVTLFVESHKAEDNLSRISFRVEDTGIGISKENLDLIFEDFVQVESDYTKKSSGTGLGLSIVKKLIELQEGKISIKSELNKGTTISFQIPYEPGKKANIKPLKKQELVIPDKVKKMKILGVDDEEFNRYLLKVIFEKWGIHHEEAQNGKEAVKKALENDYDLILMDVRMPELNGLEASKLIKKEKPQIDIIAIAAVSSESEMRLCREAGMELFISKPFSEVDLLNTLLSVLESDKENIEEVFDGFELHEIEKLANGDYEFLKEMIRIFIRSMQNGMNAILLGYEVKNWQSISDAAHKMAPPCKHMMAHDLYNNIKQLEKYTTNLVSLGSVPDLITTIEGKVERINKSLISVLDSGKFDS